MIDTSDNPVPDSWAQVSIEDCLLAYQNDRKIRQGWSPQCESYPAETLDDWGVLKTSAIQEGEYVESANKHIPPKLEPRKHLEVEAGDILITCAGPRSRCGVTCLVRKTRPKLLISGKMYQLRADPEIIDRHLLELFLREFGTKRKIDAMKTGISDSGLNLTHSRFSTLEVPIPPLNEQRRIVAKIEELFSELDDGIASLKTARAQLKIYRQALLKHAFEGKLTEQWRKDHADQLESADQLLARIAKEREAHYQQQLKDWKQTVKKEEAGPRLDSRPSKPQQPKAPQTFTNEEMADFPELPRGWIWIRLGANSVNVFDGPFGSNLKTSDYVSGGVRVVRLENIGAGEFIEDKYSYVSKEKYRSLEKHTIYPGDLVFSSFITERTRVAIIPKSIERAVNKADCFCVRCNGESANSKFLCFYLSTHFLYKQLENQIHGVGRPRINTTQLKEAPYPLCSIAEQAEILRSIDDQSSLLDDLDLTIENELQKAEALRQSILKKAFSGQLVPQDPADESATVLLERIRAERGQGATGKTPSKSTGKIVGRGFFSVKVLE